MWRREQWVGRGRGWQEEPRARREWMSKGGTTQHGWSGAEQPQVQRILEKKPELIFGKGMRTATFQFAESGGSLNSPNLFTELPFL